MKKIIIVFLFCCFQVNQSFAQQITIKHIESRLVTHQGIEFIGELKDKSDDIYSYPNWNNKGVIFVENRGYSLFNLNFNVTTNNFESRVKRGELFSYKSAQIDSVNINNHLFKKVGNSFYEVLLEKENNFFLKKYDIKYKVGSVNRLDGSEGRATTSLTYKYLVKSNDIIRKIELNKKSILSLIESDQDKENLEKFVRSKDLSYKREKDTIRIVEFIIQNSGKII